jgi:hypothetical protein
MTARYHSANYDMHTDRYSETNIRIFKRFLANELQESNIIQTLTL